MFIMLDHPEPQLMTRIAELISPVGRPRRAAQLNCPAELLTKELPLVVKRTVSACRLPASELGYVCTLQDSTVHGMRKVINRSSACHQHAISMPSACHQHAIRKVAPARLDAVAPSITHARFVHASWRRDNPWRLADGVELRDDVH
jgi:hypothetical protein